MNKDEIFSEEFMVIVEKKIESLEAEIERLNRVLVKREKMLKMAWKSINKVKSQLIEFLEKNKNYKFSYLKLEETK